MLIVIFGLAGELVATAEQPAPKGWPNEVKVVRYASSLDKTAQPMLVYAARASSERPLLVGLHTWSGGYTQAGAEVAYAQWCMEHDWHFIHPHFRGPNRHPQATGSEFAVQDIIDAVNTMKLHHDVDSERIYLVGVSGGGHAALLLAGRAPKIWAGVSAWCPISDIQAWWAQSKARGNKYAGDIERSVGGRPETDTSAAAECVRRSPLTYLQKAAAVNLDINHGIHDGRQGSVPFTHSLHAFNRVVTKRDRIATAAIDAFYAQQDLPQGLAEAKADRLYGDKRPLFRAESGNIRVTIFEGGHEIIPDAALNWLARQRKGSPANWSIDEPRSTSTSHGESPARR